MVALDNPLEARLTVVVNVILCNGNVKLPFGSEVIELFDERRFNEIIGVKEDDELAACAVKPLVSCD